MEEKEVDMQLRWLSSTKRRSLTMGLASKRIYLPRVIFAINVLSLFQIVVDSLDLFEGKNRHFQ